MVLWIKARRKEMVSGGRERRSKWVWSRKSREKFARVLEQIEI